MGNEDYPCVMGMLKENSRYKKNYNFVRINVILSLNATGLSGDA